MTETEKIMRKVLKKAPTAKMLFDSEKNLYIDVNGVNLSEEHLLPPTKDPHRAWEMADLSLKMTQNFNRTHPMRAEFYSSDDKKNRIKKRRKSKINDYYGSYDID
jgi:hypothetical protein